MKIAITGATGLIGRALCEKLIKESHQLVVLTRSPDQARNKVPLAQIVVWDALGDPPSDPALEGLDAVVNLAGASIAEGRWTEKRKQLIRDTRVRGTRNLVEGLSRCAQPPGIWVNGSAVGFYGARGDEKLDEASSPGSDFLGDICQEWEAAARKAQDMGARVVLIRTGVVLSPRGGVLGKILPPFKFFVGGPVGDGRQWMSWIHLQDEVDLIYFALTNATVEGPINGTAPNPATNNEFSSQLGAVLHRPSFMRAPGFVLRLALGEMADSLLLSGQRVFPARTEKLGFQFRFPQLRPALEHLLS